MARDLQSGVGGFDLETAGLVGSAGTSTRYGPNDLMPCGFDASRRRHLAKGEDCDTCGTSRLVDTAGEQVCLAPNGSASLPADVEGVERRGDE